jgi:hypothetical protein
MNTDKLIPISYVKKFTPLVPGDKLYGFSGDVTEGHVFSILNSVVDNFNGPENSNQYFVVSFAGRPKTGKQPVGDDVIVDVYYRAKWHTAKAWSIEWDDDLALHKVKAWRPNHAALLVKYQSEQGAKTVRQYDEQITELSTHYSAHNHGFYIQGHGMVKNARVLNSAGRWIYSDCTTNEELNGIEFWKLDAEHYSGVIDAVKEVESRPQIIEPWVAEQLTAGSEFSASAYEESCKEFEDHHESVYTQEMSDDGELPPVGTRAMLYVEYKGVNEWYPGLVCGEFMGKAVARLDDSEEEGYFDDYSADQCKPIDNRTEAMKVRDDLSSLVSGYVSCGEACDVPHYIDELLQTFEIKLNKG